MSSLLWKTKEELFFGRRMRSSSLEAERGALFLARCPAPLNKELGAAAPSGLLQVRSGSVG